MIVVRVWPNIASSFPDQFNLSTNRKLVIDERDRYLIWVHKRSYRYEQKSANSSPQLSEGSILKIIFRNVNYLSIFMQRSKRPKLPNWDSFKRNYPNHLRFILKVARIHCFINIGRFLAVFTLVWYNPRPHDVLAWILVSGLVDMVN